MNASPSPLSALAAIGFAFASTGCVGSGCNAPSVPDSDTCITPMGRGVIEQIEIGTGEGNDFTPFADGQIAEALVGGQGSTMIPAYLRITGTDLPGCLGQTTQVLLRGEVVASETRPLATYETDSGQRVTGTIFLVLDYDVSFGDQVRLTASARDVETAVTVWVDQVGSPPEVDGGAPDGGGLFDAGPPPDAAEADAADVDAAPDAS